MSLPYICPVCSGNGLVMNGFYNQVSRDYFTASLDLIKCRSCNGIGIVWDEREDLSKCFKISEEIQEESLRTKLDKELVDKMNLDLSLDMSNKIKRADKLYEKVHKRVSPYHEIKTIYSLLKEVIEANHKRINDLTKKLRS